MTLTENLRKLCLGPGRCTVTTCSSQWHPWWWLWHYEKNKCYIILYYIVRILKRWGFINSHIDQFQIYDFFYSSKGRLWVSITLFLNGTIKSKQIKKKKTYETQFNFFLDLLEIQDWVSGFCQNLKKKQNKNINKAFTKKQWALQI